MATRVGTSFSIGVILNDRAFDSSSVSDLDMVVPMNMMPFGSFTLMVTDLPDFKLESGCYGSFMFLNTGYADLDGKGFSFYVINAKQTNVNEATTKLKIDWRCATPDTLAKKTMAVTGTSLDAMIDVLKSYKEPVPYTNKVMANASSLTDTMTWRYTNASLEDMLVHTVTHSAINGDYLFWTFDEVTQRIIFSTLGISKSSSDPQALIYSNNALRSTNEVMQVDPNTNSRMWLYAYEERMSDTGEKLAETFPTMIFSSVTSAGKADITRCGGECFDKVVMSYGAENSDSARKKYGIENKNASFGDIVMVDYFPLNTHKSYAISDMIRNRILAEYSKLMVIGIYNSIGPSVGSSVAVRAIKVTSNGGNGGSDMYYTDEYVVLGKKIQKRGTTQAGVLGNNVSNQSSEYVTMLTLGSRSSGTEAFNRTMEKLENIAKACKTEMEKG